MISININNRINVRILNNKLVEISLHLINLLQSHQLKISQKVIGYWGDTNSWKYLQEESEIEM